jgi:hypothetical protein
MRNIIFRGRENTAEIGIEFDGDFSLSDLSYVTVSFGGVTYSSQTDRVIIDTDHIRVDVGNAPDLPPDGRYDLVVLAFSADYPEGFVLAHPNSGIDEIIVATLE